MSSGTAEKWKSVYTWLATAFAAPAILGALSKLDKRLDLGPILERVVLNYDLVSKYVWEAVGDFIGIELSQIHGVLTFTLICLAVILKAKPFVESFDYFSPKLVRLIELYSLSLLISILVWGSFGDGLWSIIAYSILTMVALSAFTFLMKDKPVDKYQILVILPMMALPLFVATYFFNYRVQDVIYSYFFIFVIFAIRIVRLDDLFFTKIVVFCIGVYAFDFLVTVVIPWINQTLDEIGA